MVTGGLIVYFFLPAYPEDVGFPGSHAQDSHVKPLQEHRDEETQSHKGVAADTSAAWRTSMARSNAVGPIEACLIPGVIPFSLCLFFSKLVAYTFLYWLPFYLSQTVPLSADMAVKSN